ncbi:MAG: PIG-L family deacetylase [Candidatus Methanomethylicus sp.]|nr:PIG-L family deacetylase [Candidatus Methanomethylicus sp.]
MEKSETVTNKTVLAVGAHPDDIELGCAASLVLFKQRGFKVHLLVMTKGEASGNPAVREEECRKSSVILKVDSLQFGNIKDTCVAFNRETVNVIERVIEQVNPGIIFGPTIKDTHQDHQGTGQAVLAAGRRSKKILLYEGASTLRDFIPQVFIDVEHSMPIKLKATQVFSSQLDQSGTFARAYKAIDGLAKFRGYQAGVIAAEAFEVGKFIFDL